MGAVEGNTNRWLRDAEKLIGDVDEILDDHRLINSDEAAYLYTQVTATQALACATLALAEQQRVANLIAIVQSEVNFAIPKWATGGPYESLVDEIRLAVSL